MRCLECGTLRKASTLAILGALGLLSVDASARKGFRAQHLAILDAVCRACPGLGAIGHSDTPPYDSCRSGVLVSMPWAQEVRGQGALSFLAHMQANYALHSQGCCRASRLRPHELRFDGQGLEFGVASQRSPLRFLLLSVFCRWVSQLGRLSGHSTLRFLMQ